MNPVESQAQLTAALKCCFHNNPVINDITTSNWLVSNTKTFTCIDTL